MTEPHEPAPPLSRMRFSWQRGTGRPGVENEPPDVVAEDRSSDVWPDDDPPTGDAAHAQVMDDAPEDAFDVLPEPEAGGQSEPWSPADAPDGYEDTAPDEATYDGAAYDGATYDEGDVGSGPLPGAEPAEQLEYDITPEGAEPVVDIDAPGVGPDSIDPSNVDPDNVDLGSVGSGNVGSEAVHPDVDDAGHGAVDADDGLSRTDGFEVADPLERDGEPDPGPDPIQTFEFERDVGDQPGATASPRPTSRARPRPTPSRSRRSRRSEKATTTAGRFDVPTPGGRFSGGRGSHTAVKVTVVLSSCLVAVGIVAYLTFSFAVSVMRDSTYRLSEADITRYRLSDFPLEQAGRFAADYARICLTHDPTPGAHEQREAQLARYVSSGTDSRCGWNGEGAQSVLDASWTGESEPIDVPGYAGHARMMTVRVLTSTGSRIVTVPVYVEDLVTGDGMRVVGDIGEVPQPNLVAAPEPTAPAAIDGALGEALTQGEFFLQFFTAWGDSNGPALQRFVTPDATARTTSGLGGTLTAPTIREVRIFLPKGADVSEGTFEWKTGMVTEAWVWVAWRSPGVGDEAVETRAYRLQLVKTTQAASPSQEWAVRDIRGGVPDLKGG